jgi:ribonuclease Z
VKGRSNRHAAGLALFVALLATPAEAQTIKVTLLGTGRPDPAIDRFGPSTLVEAGGETLLFDVGRGASQRLWQLKIPLSRVTAVFLTHLHSDHVIGLPDLWLTGWLPAPFGGRATPLGLRGPVGTRGLAEGLRQAFQWDVNARRAREGLPEAGIALSATELTEGVALERGGVTVTAFLVDHGEHLEPAYGYRVDYQGRSVVISGDTRPSDNLVRHATGIDVLVHEVFAARAELLDKSATARRILDVHTTPEDAGRIFSRVKPRLAVYSHLVLFSNDPAISPLSVADILSRTRTIYDGTVESGEDLMVIEIGERIKVRRPASPPP